MAAVQDDAAEHRAEHAAEHYGQSDLTSALFLSLKTVRMLVTKFSEICWRSTYGKVFQNSLVEEC